MNKTMKMIFLFLLSIANTACVMFNGNIDSKKLNNKNEKYGVVIFRPMQFHNTKSAYLLYARGKGHRLTKKNRLSVTVPTGKSSWVWISNLHAIDGKTIREERFTIEPGGFFKDAVLKPEYFYGVTMLPEGKHNVRSMGYYEGNAVYSLKEANNYYFYVKADHVNYIGDLYLLNLSLEKRRLFFSDIYSSNVVICDRYQDAKSFLEEFCSDIKLPFTKRLINKNKSIKK